MVNKLTYSLIKTRAEVGRSASHKERRSRAKDGSTLTSHDGAQTWAEVRRPASHKKKRSRAEDGAQ